MYYKQALKPNELLPALSDSGECFYHSSSITHPELSSCHLPVR